MTKATVQPTCGLVTIIEARHVDSGAVAITIESECKSVRRIGEELGEINPYQEMTFRGGEPRVLVLGREHCSHTSCPVPVAVIKAAEIAAGMDLPKPVKIEFTED